MKITVYRGTHEIGGTLIALKTQKSRILLDAGYPLFLNGLAIDGSIASQSEDKLLVLGVLPAIAGLYKWDKPGFDAIIISHAHLDHYGLLKYVHPDIPVYMSAGTKRIIELSQLFKIVDNFNLITNEFKMYEVFQVKDFNIKPYLMDHSAFDAAAFEISAEDKTVIYSGDFRGHGRKAKCLDRFIKDATKQTDILLTEGTMLGRQHEKVMTEPELERKMKKEIEDLKGPVLVQSSSQNIDRIVSFYKAAIALGRTFVVDVYTANVLCELRQLGNQLPYPSKQYPAIKVFYPRRLTKKIFDEIGEKYAWRFSSFRISRADLATEQNNIVMMVRTSMLKDIESCKLHDGLFIYSMWKGYRDSEYQQKFEKYLESVGFISTAIHTSGHARVADIKRLIDGLDPKKIGPIHTMDPDAFTDFSGKTIKMEDGKEFEI